MISFFLLWLKIFNFYSLVLENHKVLKIWFVCVCVLVMTREDLRCFKVTNIIPLFSSSASGHSLNWGRNPRGFPAAHGSNFPHCVKETINFASLIKFCNPDRPVTRSMVSHIAIYWYLKVWNGICIKTKIICNDRS